MWGRGKFNLNSSLSESDSDEFVVEFGWPHGLDGYMDGIPCGEEGARATGQEGGGARGGGVERRFAGRKGPGRWGRRVRVPEEKV